jgi:hypothetical protein
MDEVDVVCCRYFQLVSHHFVLNFFAEMVINPTNVSYAQTPLDIAHNDEVVHS